MTNSGSVRVEMTLGEYQRLALVKKTYGIGQPVYYPGFGIGSEAGEVAGKLMRLQRDHNGVLNQERKLEIAKELGDCLWYITACAEDLGLTLEDIAILNLEKVKYRNENNKIHGEGDNR